MTKYLILPICVVVLSGCRKPGACESDIGIDRSRGACTEQLSDAPSVQFSVSGNMRTIVSNNIPDHKVGLFGQVAGAINPNAITAQSSHYEITTQPAEANQLTSLLGPHGPAWSFGILLNGVELDPTPAEPFPHDGNRGPDANWDWNLEATNVSIGLDCSDAHVQPNGKYHYHGTPNGYLDNLQISGNQMTLIGYAGDGFPIYYLYAFEDAMDSASAVVAMTSSYRLREGERPGDGVDAPCGAYDGVYAADYEYIPSLGTLDETNGRYGVTPEYPSGTYYYVLNDAFPFIPRAFRGTPSDDFKLGG